MKRSVRDLLQHATPSRLFALAPLTAAVILAACGSYNGSSADAPAQAGTPDTSSSTGASGDTGGAGAGQGSTDPGAGTGGGSGSGGGSQTPAPGPTVKSADSQIQLQWTDVNGAEGYVVYYSQNATLDVNTATRLNDSVGVITGTSVVVPGLTNGTTYYAWVAPVTGGTEGTAVSIGDATPTAGGLAVQAAQVQPPMNGVEVNPGTPIRIPFGVALDPATVDGTSVKVKIGGTEQQVTVALIDNGQTIEVTPVSGAWQTGATHEVSVTDAVKSAGGDALRNALTYTFKTLDTASLIAWYEFDNALTDLSGNGNTITQNNGVTFANGPTQRKSGTHAAYFDGSSYMVLNDANFDLGDKFSVAFWVYMPSLQSNINTILSNVGPNVAPSGFKLGINSWLALDQRVILEGGDGTQGGKALTGTGFVQDGQWYHFAYNIDKTANLPNGKHVQIFFNGVEATVDYDSNNGTGMDGMNWANMKSTGPLWFGAMVGGSYLLNNAYIDDLRIYNRALSAAEVVNISR